MNDKRLIISKRMKGEDGHKVFSIRIKDETVARLDELSGKTNRSRNDLINLLLEYAIEHCDVE